MRFGSSHDWNGRGNNTFSWQGGNREQFWREQPWISPLVHHDQSKSKSERALQCYKLPQPTLFCDSGQNSYSRPLYFVCIETTEQTYHCCYKVLLGELFHPYIFSHLTSNSLFLISWLYLSRHVFIQKLETTLWWKKCCLDQPIHVIIHSDASV